MNLSIAIDGPVAAGKSSTAKLLSSRLRLTYIDTGAMYRAVAYAAMQGGVDWEDAKAMTQLAKEVKIRLARPVGDKNDGRTVSVYLNGEDVSWKIRDIESGEGASIIGQHKDLRRVMVKLQRQMAEGHDVVMEGRDIGTVVLPKATLKIYLTADQGERIKRKQEKLEGMGLETTRQEVKKDVTSRDKREMTRQVDPLKPAEDAWHLDTTDLSLEQVVEKIEAKVEELVGD
ncbi:MAG: (d)CMP kinase [Candidatus Pacebacteria bacterium]|nr:(d)CMP kinase [Candidatus Paceibacterota bacterium]